ncbi:MAG: hypothetical protein P8O22_06755 [Akkermansiaceae bacterium]|nr:hypothetical protein [Akkermansiaceae bacterium]
MKFNQLTIYALICLIYAAVTAAAQQDNQSTVSTRVDLVSMGENITGLYLGKKTNQRVTALPFRYNRTIRYKGDRVLAISQTTVIKRERPMSEEDKKHAIKPIRREGLPSTEVDQRGKLAKAIAKRRKTNPNLVALAVVPLNARHITILLTPAAKNTYRTTVINDDPSKLPYGKMRAYNFCTHPISLRFNKGKAIVLAPQKNRQTKPNQDNTLGYLLRYPKNNQWKTQENNIIRVTPDEQVQMLVLNSNSSFFASSSGSRGGKLQVAILRRNKALKKPKTPDPSQDNNKTPLPSGFD